MDKLSKLPDIPRYLLEPGWQELAGEEERTPDLQAEMFSHLTWWQPGAPPPPPPPPLCKVRWSGGAWWKWYLWWCSSAGTGRVVPQSSHQYVPCKVQARTHSLISHTINVFQSLSSGHRGCSCTLEPVAKYFYAFQLNIETIRWPVGGTWERKRKVSVLSSLSILLWIWDCELRSLSLPLALCLKNAIPANCWLLQSTFDWNELLLSREFRIEVTLYLFLELRMKHRHFTFHWVKL